MKKCENDEDVMKWIQFVEDRPFNDLRYPMNSDKLSQLGWKPKLSWEEGLQQTSKHANAGKSFNFVILI